MAFDLNNNMKRFLIFLLFIFPFTFERVFVQEKIPVIISTDIGGDDPDDHQSLIHFLLYADQFEILGLISSPPGKGRKSDLDQVLGAYEADFPKLKNSGLDYPDPEVLKRVSFQGAIEPQEGESPVILSEGARFLANQVLNFEKPVYILVWGSMTDLAQAIHFFPEIKPLVRVYSIGSWNTQQDPKSREYLWLNHPDFWWIENNTTFRGMYMGGNQDGPWGNEQFISESVKGFGELGNLFFEKKKDIKMGDTPSVHYLLHGNAENPEGESWGGSFAKQPDRSNYWSDRQNPELMENGRFGAKTINKFRQEYLSDWKDRISVLK